MSNEVNATKANEAPTRLADGTYQPVLTVSDLDRCGRRWMLGASIYNYESQCAPAVMFATEPALRKIYAGDEEGYRRSLLSTYRYYNATPQVSGLLLGAGLALEDKGHNDAIDAVQDLKVSCGLTFTMGDVTLDVQTGILDQIMVGMLPVIATAIVYALVKRKVSINKIVLGILIISWVCAAFGILAA